MLDAACEIEAWNYKQFTHDKIKIDGVTTCKNGVLTLKLYDGERKYFANKTTYLKAGTFKTFVDGVAPKKMTIKYSIRH